MLASFMHVSQGMELTRSPGHQYTKGTSLNLTIALYFSQSAPYFLLHACSSLNSRCTAYQDNGEAAASLQISIGSMTW